MSHITLFTVSVPCQQKASTGLQLWSGVDSAVRVALVVCFLLSLPDLYWLYPLIGHLWMIFVANLLLYVGVKDKVINIANVVRGRG